MARVRIFDEMPGTQNWAEFMDPKDVGLITFQSATAMTFKYAAGEYANWKVVARGTGFTYVTNEAGDKVPIGGSITDISVFDETGALVMRIDQFVAGTRMNLADYYYTIFNTGSDADTRNGANLFTQLLRGGDVFIGSNNGDQIAAGQNAGNDTISGGLGDDFVKGDQGSDRIDGGDDTDTLSYQNSFFDDTSYKGINLNAQTGIVLDCWGGRDTISNFEEFRGSRFNDVIIGTDVDREKFAGLRGNDTLDGSGGLRDEAYYDRDARFGGSLGIIVDLQVSTANGHIIGSIRDGFGYTDRVIDIERVKGTMKNDVFVGSAVDNVFAGLAGKDSYNGDLGRDTLSFVANSDLGALVGVDVDLRLATGQVKNDGFGNVENAVSMESVFGSKLADSIRGNVQQNFIQGDLGADTLWGGGGADTFNYSGLLSFGDIIKDFQAGIDKIVIVRSSIPGMTGTLNFTVGEAPIGSVSAFFFKPSDNTLYWDRDGTGTGYAAVAVATLEGVTSISSSDILI
jgi:Ca2+-binding RTX toxin-like protein